MDGHFERPRKKKQNYIRKWPENKRKKKKAVRWMFVVSSLVKTAGVANIYIPTPWFLLLLSTTKQVEELAINNLNVYCLCAVLCVQVAIISWLFTV